MTVGQQRSPAHAFQVIHFAQPRRIKVQQQAFKIDKQVYDRVVYGSAREGIIARLFKQLNGYGYDGKNGFEHHGRHHQWTLDRPRQRANGTATGNHRGTLRQPPLLRLLRRRIDLRRSGSATVRVNREGQMNRDTQSHRPRAGRCRRHMGRVQRTDHVPSAPRAAAGITTAKMGISRAIEAMKNIPPPYRRKPHGTGCGNLLRMLLLFALPLASASASMCYGTEANGRLQGAVQLPAEGKNYVAYSSLGVTLGRTYVHQAVRDIVVDAYDAAYLSMPEKRFMYGETGLADGGPFKPHHTHQAGVSVDFMVPVLDRDHKSMLLPTTALNKFGYGLEFDDGGALGDLRIDFEAMAEHLYQLAEAAKQHKVPIKRVIFQKQLVTLLLQTTRGSYLRNLPFMKATPWIRHDEHYHVDFALPCRPLSEYKAALK